MSDRDDTGIKFLGVREYRDEHEIARLRRLLVALESHKKARVALLDFSVHELGGLRTIFCMPLRDDEMAEVGALTGSLLSATTAFCEAFLETARERLAPADFEALFDGARERFMAVLDEMRQQPVERPAESGGA